MSTIDGSSLLDLLAKRESVINCLLSHNTKKPEIETELGVSRQTVGRALTELEAADIVIRVGDDYELTLYGKLAYQEHNIRRTHCEILSKAKDFLTPLPGEVSMPFSVLDQAEIQFTELPLPLYAIPAIESALRTSETITAMFPLVFPKTLDLLTTLIQTKTLDAEFFLEAELSDKLLRCYPNEMNALSRADNCVIWQIEEKPLLGILQLDTKRVWLCHYEPGGGISGTLANHSTETVEWTTHFFRQQKKQATNFTIR